MSQTNGLWNTSRGRQRYDPETRRYVLWELDNDFPGKGIYGTGINGSNGNGYPRFTASERDHIERRRLSQLKPVPQNRQQMGRDWDGNGPRVRISLSAWTTSLTSTAFPRRS
jgi:hypothetical protein